MKTLCKITKCGNIWHLLLCAFILLAAAGVRPLQGQTITFLDAESNIPVNNVSGYNQTQRISAVSTQNGRMRFASLNIGDTLIVYHHSYEQQLIVFDSSLLGSPVVYLIQRSYDLEPVVVTSHRFEQKRSETSIQLVSISAQEASFQNPQTTADLLGQTHKVFVQKSQLGGGSPMLRGFAANSVLLVVDGVRMNNAIYRSGNLQNVIALDPNFIEHTEVIFGPSSVIYGSDALGGVMVFNTHQPALAIERDRIFNASSFLRYSSAMNEKSAHIRLSAGSRKWASTTGITYTSFGDLRTGSKRNDLYPNHGKRKEYVSWDGTQDRIIDNENVNVMTPSGYEQINIAQKLRFRPNEHADIQYGFHFSTSTNIPRYDRLIEYRQGRLRFADWYYGPQKWMMHNLHARIYRNRGWFDNSKLTLAYQFNEESRYSRNFGNLFRTGRTEHVHAFVLNTDFEKSLGEETHIYYGMEGLYNRIGSEGSTVNIVTQEQHPASTRYPDGENNYGSIAGYGFVRHRFSDLFAANVGIRYSRIFLHSTLIDTTFYRFPFREIDINTGSFNGTLGVILIPTDGIQLNANLSSGFRAPNLDDAGKVFESEPGNVIVPNPDLKPEYAIGGDMGIIYNQIKWLHAEINAFYTHLFDVMVRRDFTYLGNDSIVYNDDLSKVQAIVNSGKGYIYGTSIGFQLTLGPSFHLRSSLTYTYGQEIHPTDTIIPLRHIPPLYGATSLSYNTGLFRMDASVIYQGAKKREDLDPSERAKTHIYTDKGSLTWFTLNAKAAYQFNRFILVNIGIENIFDRHYWPYASGIPGPGRNVYVSLRFKL